MKVCRKQLAIPLAVAVTAVSAGGAEAQFPVADSATVDHSQSVASVDVDGTFAALRTPALEPAEISAVVRHQIAVAPVGVQKTGVAISDVRQVSAGGRSFYIARGTSGMCLFLNDGSSVCLPDAAYISKYGLALTVVPPALGKVVPGMNPIGAGPVVTYGVAPDGIAGVDGRAADGSTVHAAVSGNAYVAVSSAFVPRWSMTNTDNSTWSPPTTPMN